MKEKAYVKKIDISLFLIKKLHVNSGFTWSKSWIWISIIKWNIKRLLVVLHMGL